MGNDPCMPIIRDLLMLSIFVLSELFSGSFCIMCCWCISCICWPSYDEKDVQYPAAEPNPYSYRKTHRVRHVEKIT